MAPRVFPRGKLTIGGKTINEAVELLRALYRDGFLVNPQINLTIRAYAKQRFTILGQVHKPGGYDMEAMYPFPFSGPSDSPAVTRIADPGNITVKRRRANGLRKSDSI